MWYTWRWRILAAVAQSAENPVTFLRIDSLGMRAAGTAELCHTEHSAVQRMPSAGSAAAGAPERHRHTDPAPTQRSSKVWHWKSGSTARLGSPAGPDCRDGSARRVCDARAARTGPARIGQKLRAGPDGRIATLGSGPALPFPADRPSCRPAGRPAPLPVVRASYGRDTGPAAVRRRGGRSESDPRVGGCPPDQPAKSSDTEGAVTAVSARDSDLLGRLQVCRGRFERADSPCPSDPCPSESSGRRKRSRPIGSGSGPGGGRKRRNAPAELPPALQARAPSAVQQKTALESNQSPCAPARVHGRRTPRPSQSDCALLNSANGLRCQCLTPGGARAGRLGFR